MKRYIEIEKEGSVFLEVFYVFYSIILPFINGFFFALTGNVFFFLYTIVPIFFRLKFVSKDEKKKVYTNE